MQVRVLAEKYQLPTRARKDSQGICFLGKLKFDEFIEHYLGENEGPIRCYQTGNGVLILSTSALLPLHQLLTTSCSLKH